MRSKIGVVWTLLIIFFPKWSYPQGCSQCKLLVEQGSELGESSFGSNINLGILFLMVIPYLIIIIIFREQIKNFLRLKFGRSKY
tara:strand:+ start:263 stop:514 length:252 start_codon:yes stop_codon:yes gene_type:complete